MTNALKPVKYKMITSILIVKQSSQVKVTNWLKVKQGKILYTIPAMQFDNLNEVDINQVVRNMVVDLQKMVTTGFSRDDKLMVPTRPTKPKKKRQS